MNLPSRRGSYLVVFLWRLDWLFPVWVPRLYVLSAKRIETMQRGFDPDRPSAPIKVLPKD